MNFQVDQRVRVKPTGTVGFITKIEEGRVIVRVPSTTDWPFPSYVYTSEDKLAYARSKKKEPVLDNLEEALF